MNDANDAKYKFERISEAYQVLSDEGKRVSYDQKLEFGKASWTGLRTK